MGDRLGKRGREQERHAERIGRWTSADQALYLECPDFFQTLGGWRGPALHRLPGTDDDAKMLGCVLDNEVALLIS
eukprot:6400807-Pyramimonas_sp.AAC.1